MSTPTKAAAKRKRRAVRNLRNALHGAHGPKTQQRVTDALDAFLIRRTSLPNDPPTR